MLKGMIIGVWGDSITYGSCDSEALGWVGRIRKVLKKDDYSNIYNFGVCGDTSKDLLMRFVIEAKAIKPDHIIFAVGINDSKFFETLNIHKVSLSDYKVNLDELILSAKRYTQSIAIISATKVDSSLCSSGDNLFMNEEIAKFNEVLVTLSNEYGLKYINVFETIDPVTDLEDGLHPNAKGYQKMFEIIKSNLSWL